MLKKEKTFDKVWKQVEIELLSVDYFFAHNAPFDRSVLHSSCNYYNIDLPPQEFKDTVILARKYWDFENNKLNTVCKHLRIPLNHHDALSDAKGCALIAIEAFKKGYVI
jgi:DNA polymerase-3 subunit epsilon